MKLEPFPERDPDKPPQGASRTGSETPPGDEIPGGTNRRRLTVHGVVAKMA